MPGRPVPRRGRGDRTDHWTGNPDGVPVFCGVKTPAAISIMYVLGAPDLVLGPCSAAVAQLEVRELAAGGVGGERGAGPVTRGSSVSYPATSSLIGRDFQNDYDRLPHSSAVLALLKCRKDALEGEVVSVIDVDLDVSRIHQLVDTVEDDVGGVEEHGDVGNPPAEE